ncbi:MAG: pilus assembly protein PilM [Fimbriimonadaceae bacterium]|nr:pilus assembly protein PilM [Fimbriimonadaceae bacterium]
MARARRGHLGGLPLVGVDVGRHSIKVSWLDPRTAAPTVVGLARTATPAGLFDPRGRLAARDALGDCLRQLLHELGLPDARAVSAIGAPFLALGSVHLPALPASALPAAAAAAVVGEPAPWSGAHAVDWRLAPAPNALDGALDLLVTAAPQQLVDDLTGALLAARLDPIVIEALPHAPLFLLASAEDESWQQQELLLVDCGEGHCTARWVVAGEVQRATVLPTGGAALTARLAQAAECTTAEALAYKEQQLGCLTEAEAAFDEPCAAALEEWLQALVEGLRGAAEGPPAQVLLHGGGAQLAGLPEVLAARLGWPVERLEPFAEVAAESRAALPPAVTALGPAFVNCLGLALREAVVAS